MTTLTTMCLESQVHFFLLFLCFINYSIQVGYMTLKWLVATSDQKDVNFKIVQSLLSTKSQSILAHNL